MQREPGFFLLLHLRERGQPRAGPIALRMFNQGGAEFADALVQLPLLDQLLFDQGALAVEQDAIRRRAQEELTGKSQSAVKD